MSISNVTSPPVLDETLQALVSLIENHADTSEATGPNELEAGTYTKSLATDASLRSLYTTLKTMLDDDNADKRILSGRLPAVSSSNVLFDKIQESIERDVKRGIIPCSGNLANEISGFQYDHMLCVWLSYSDSYTFCLAFSEMNPIGPFYAIVSVYDYDYVSEWRPLSQQSFNTRTPSSVMNTCMSYLSTCDDAFLYYVDSKIIDDNTYQDKIFKMAKRLGDLWNELPVQYVISGGGDAGSMANPTVNQYRLPKFLNNVSRMLDGHFYPANGTHVSASYLLQPFMAYNYKNGTDSYYTFNGVTTKFFVMDGGYSGESDVTPLINSEIAWLGSLLLTNQQQHIAVIFHSLQLNNSTTTKAGQKIMQMIHMFNNRMTRTIHGITYDFTNAVGKVEFVVTGSYAGWMQQNAGGTPYIQVPQMFEMDEDNGELKVHMFCFVAEYHSRRLRVIDLSDESTLAERVYNLDTGGLVT
jgi:hypothetical protein